MSTRLRGASARRLVDAIEGELAVRPSPGEWTMVGGRVPARTLEAATS